MPDLYDEEESMKTDRIEILDDVMLDVLKKKTPYERLQIAFGLWRSARYLLHVHLLAQHPEWEEDKLNREIAKRMSHGAA